MTRGELIGTAAVAMTEAFVGPRYARLRIVHSPDSLASRIAFTPADAERYAIATRLVSDRATIEDLAGAIDDARPVHADGTVDVRWNLTFSEGPGGSVRHVSIDRFGRRALIDGVAANMDGADLVMRLKRAVT